MKKRSVVDTNIIEDLQRRGKLLTSKRVREEMVKRDLSPTISCLRIESEPSKATSSCMKKVFLGDLKNNLRKLSPMDRRDVRKMVSKTIDIPEITAWDHRAWDLLSERTGVRNYYSELTSVRNDCSLIGLAKKRKANLLSNDKNLINACKAEYREEKCLTLPFL